MRITSGTAKGHIIRMPAGPEIRPTLDITRKAVFDIIGSDIEGSSFLDLFAGTGANGIEALSRGASFAVFIDNSVFCSRAIRENLEKTRLIERAEIYRKDVFRFLESSGKSRGPADRDFDVVFADPPYNRKTASYTFDRDPSPAKTTLQLLSTGNILIQNPVVVIEHPQEMEMPEIEGILTIWKVRRYGSTGISIYRKRQ